MLQIMKHILSSDRDETINWNNHDESIIEMTVNFIYNSMFKSRVLNSRLKLELTGVYI